MVSFCNSISFLFSPTRCGVKRPWNKFFCKQRSAPLARCTSSNAESPKLYCWYGVLALLHAVNPLPTIDFLSVARSSPSSEPWTAQKIKLSHYREMNKATNPIIPSAITIIIGIMNFVSPPLIFTFTFPDPVSISCLIL